MTWQFTYHLWELFIFAMIGLVCGGLGAAFVGLNGRLTVVRGRWIKSKQSKLLEVIIYAADGTPPSADGAPADACVMTRGRCSWCAPSRLS